MTLLLLLLPPAETAEHIEFAITAARIEGMTKELGHPLLISESTWLILDEKTQFAKLPPQIVRGRKTQIVLYADNLSSNSPS